MSADLELFHYWRSSCSWRVRWALNLKNLDCKLTPVNLLKSEQKANDYIKHSPSEFVPTLRVGDEYYSESMAIIEWLDEVYQVYPLLPKALKEKMMVRQLYQTISCGTQPLQNLAAQKYYSDDLDKRKVYAQHWITKGLYAYEKLLENGEPGKFSFGDQVSMADLCLIPQVYNAIRFEVDMDQFPLIQGINQRCLDTEACHNASPAMHEPKS